VPEGVGFPAIAYSVISDQATLVIPGPSAARNPRVQLSIVAATQKEAVEISELVKQCINTWSQTYDDIVVEASFAEGSVYLSLDYYTPAAFGLIIEAFIYWRPV
jgi:hypothetical protein